jgi:hypothetical protein
MVISGTFRKVLVVNNVKMELFSLDPGSFVILLFRGVDNLDSGMSDYTFIAAGIAGE